MLLVWRSSNLGTEETGSANTRPGSIFGQNSAKIWEQKSIKFPTISPPPFTSTHCSQNESTGVWVWPLCTPVSPVSRLKLALICNNKQYKGKLFLSHPPSPSLRFSQPSQTVKHQSSSPILYCLHWLPVASARLMNLSLATNRTGTELAELETERPLGNAAVKHWRVCSRV